MRVATCAITILCLVSAAASADILEWQDATGVRHYTNLKGEVPKENQESVQVVVDELARRVTAPEAAAAPACTGQCASSPPTEPRREAEVIYDRSPVSAAYLAGVQQGLEAARTTSSGGSVQINGPLAVANAFSRPPYEYAAPYYHPFVTTSFDRGRSRHLTLRMLLQDQLMLGRDGPLEFEKRRIPRLGVALNPFLPRGLPHGFPRQTRVVTR